MKKIGGSMSYRVLLLLNSICIAEPTRCLICIAAQTISTSATDATATASRIDTINAVFAAVTAPSAATSLTAYSTAATATQLLLLQLCTVGRSFVSIVAFDKLALCAVPPASCLSDFYRPSRISQC